MLKKLLGSVREYKKPTIWTIVLIVGEVIIECMIPFLTVNLINQIKEQAATQSGTMKEVLSVGIILVLMAIASLLCGALAGLSSAKASAGFAKNLREDIFERIQNFSFSNIDKFSSSSLVTRLTTDITHVQMSYMMMIRIAIRSPLMLIFSTVMAFRTGGSALAMSFVVVIPFLAFGLFMVGKLAMPAFRRVFKKYDRLNESIEENVRAMRVVKGFSREEYEKKKFSSAAEEICKDFTKAERIVAFNHPLMQLCLYFNMAFVLFMGSKTIISTKAAVIDVGQLSAMLTYGMQVLMSLMTLSMIYVMLTMSLEAMRRISEVLTETPDIKNPEKAVTTIENGSVRFENVNFKYSKDAKLDSLQNINLKIESGMTVGIIGGTGSGKTSLVQLISRLYDATSGAVYVAGRDVREYDLTALRDSVAFVLQKNLIFSGTIAENLRWGNENATDEELRQACELAQAQEFINSFPDGYNTMIEQGGTNVSGGQKQRLCIARALLKKPKILILDDSTSAVDTKTDALIREGFRKFIPETTKIIIAQRVASVQESDMIVVMDGGKIAATGTHEELLKTSEIYKEVYEQQTNGGDE